VCVCVLAFRSSVKLGNTTKPKPPPLHLTRTERNVVLHVAQCCDLTEVRLVALFLQPP